jgi:XRE family transcriptional regulator, master regulator for biofilm formation
MADRVREMRKAKELSLSQLAARAGLTKAYLVRIESAKPPNVSLRVVEQLAEALDVAPGWLAWGAR